MISVFDKKGVLNPAFQQRILEKVDKHYVYNGTQCESKKGLEFVSHQCCFESGLRGMLATYNKSFPYWKDLYLAGGAVLACLTNRKVMGCQTTLHPLFNIRNAILNHSPLIPDLNGIILAYLHLNGQPCFDADKYHTACPLSSNTQDYKQQCPWIRATVIDRDRFIVKKNRINKVLPFEKQIIQPDLDFFQRYELSPAKIQEIDAFVQDTIKTNNGKSYYMQSQYALTIFRPDAPNFQIINKKTLTCKSLSSILNQFDLDICQFGFDGKTVVATEQALKCIQTSYFRSQFPKEQQKARIIKYLSRYPELSFLAKAPFTDHFRHRIRYRILSLNTHFTSGTLEMPELHYLPENKYLIPSEEIYSDDELVCGNYATSNEYKQCPVFYAHFDIPKFRASKEFTTYFQNKLLSSKTESTIKTGPTLKSIQESKQNKRKAVDLLHLSAAKKAHP